MFLSFGDVPRGPVSGLAGQDRSFGDGETEAVGAKQNKRADSTHLLVGKAQLVLEDRLAIGQVLHLVG